MQDPIITPLFVAAGVTGSLTIGTATISYASLLTSATLIAGSIALNYALAPKTANPQGPQPNDGAQALNQNIPPRIGAYGRNRIAGNYMLYTTSSLGRSLDVQAFVSGRIVEFVQWYLHDDPISLTGSTVNGGSDGRYENSIQIDYRLGEESQTAFASAVADAPLEWTTDHQGNGIACAFMGCVTVAQEEFTRIYPNGLPQLSAVLDGYPVHDIRSADHLRTDEETWEVSYNPVINLIDYLTHADHGMGMSYERRILPVLAELGAQADLCDDQIDLSAGGTENRYQASLWYNFDTDPAVVIGDFLAACDGWIGLNGDGTVSIKVGVYEEDDSEALTDDHVIDIEVDYGVPDQDRVEELVVAFTSPDHDYRSIAGDPWRDEDAISLRGKVRSRPFNPKAVQSHTQARRLAKRNMTRMNAPIRGRLTTHMFGLIKQGRRWINVDLPESGIPELVDAVVEVRTFEANYASRTCTINFVVVDPDTIDDWDADEEEGTNAPQPFQEGRTALETPENVEVEQIGSSEQYEISFDELERPGLTYVLNYRLYNDGTGGQGPWTRVDIVTATTAGGRTSFVIPFGLPDNDAYYEMQVAARASGRTVGSFSESVYPRLETETVALSERMSVAPDGERLGVINDLIAALKAAAVWTKLDGFYILAAHDSQAALLNWVQDAFNLTVVGAATFGTDTGYDGFTSSIYLDTGFIPSTATPKLMTLNDAHIGVYVRENVASANFDCGTAAGTSHFDINSRSAGDRIIGSVFANGDFTDATVITDGRGHTCLSRSSSSNVNVFKNGGAASANSSTSNSLTAVRNLLFGAKNLGTPSAKGAALGAGHMGMNLTESENAALRTALQAYMTAVGAAV